MKILLVEDDPRLSRSLARLLEQDRHNVEVAADGETGLDIALGENGIDVVDPRHRPAGHLGPRGRAADPRSEREELAILMLTARDTVGDRVTGLDSGADDYVVKPFSLRRARRAPAGARPSGRERGPPAGAAAHGRPDQPRRDVPNRDGP